MKNFKVICKADSRYWIKAIKPTRIVTTTKFFGLIKSSKVVPYDKNVPGPGNDEICIVTSVYINDLGTFYDLAGYPYGGYDSKHFIKLDEFTETQKEIAEKSVVIPN